MTEAELLSQFATLGQAFLSGLLATFTIVSAYLVALYAFLGAAPLALRVVAFAFFSATLMLLGVFLAGSLAYADGVAIALNDLVVASGASRPSRLVTDLSNHNMAYFLAYASVALGVSLYGALFFLTFFFNWPTKSAQANG
jgi:hypothetical protein